ncbi:hypothetical protein CCZ37_12335 [Vibrio qinghaiensis]|uniref:Uncharacterized protein n=1 Tax=Vibrio qinghaiensis TaxID=2025808 RepID=A0A223N0L9_9VIBR|nr:hypothetical protein CCZ37_12335 [Vibrio qinghaiensis]
MCLSINVLEVIYKNLLARYRPRAIPMTVLNAFKPMIIENRLFIKSAMQRAPIKLSNYNAINKKVEKINFDFSIFCTIKGCGMIHRLLLNVK